MFIQWYVNIDGTENMELISSASVNHNTIRSGGYLTLMQEQDSVGKLSIIRFPN